MCKYKNLYRDLNVNFQGLKHYFEKNMHRPIRLGKKENPFSFSNLFYKYQTNLNFDDFYSHKKIQEHFTTRRKKYASV
jgi:hypothetical protein